MDPVLQVIYVLIFPGFAFLIGYALFMEYIDRKVMARMQTRVGPPLLQPLADTIKLFGKEVIDPKGVDRRAFDIVPLIAFASVLAAFLYIPVVGPSPFAFQGDLVLVLFLLTIPAIALLIIGWLSRNVYSMIGGVRAMTMMFIYEVPFFLVLLAPALMAGSWSISDIVAWESQNLWFAILQPIGFVIGIVGLQAKLERTPFDIPEAETELVAGPWTELTGRRLAVMHLAMCAALVVGSALIAALFLGGPETSFVIGPAWLAGVVGFVLFLVKTLAILMVLAIFRVATGRIRIDQLNMIGWKYLANAAIVQVVLVVLMNYWWLST